jgi:Flp pilus assembly protein TadG
MTFWNRFRRDTRGGTAAEMALILPGVAFIIMNVTDLGLYTYTRMQVGLAAQEAAGTARVKCTTAAQMPTSTNCSGITTAMNTASQKTTLGSTVTVVTQGEGYYCPTSGGALQAVTTTPTPATCTAATGLSSAPGYYIQIRATKTYKPVFQGATVTSYLVKSISRDAWMRLI